METMKVVNDDDDDDDDVVDDDNDDRDDDVDVDDSIQKEGGRRKLSILMIHFKQSNSVYKNKKQMNANNA